MIYIFTSFYGDVSDFGWVSFYDFFSRIGVVKNILFERYKKTMKANVFYLLLTDFASFVSKPPVVLKRDYKGRMHCTDAAAIQFADGYCQHYVKGVFFEPVLFEKIFVKKSITPKEIMKIKNVEQKAVVMEEYGIEKMLSELKVELLDSRKRISQVNGKEVKEELIEFKISENVTIRALKLDDHSQEKTYIIGVPRESGTETLQGALKWKFPTESKDYCPVIET